MRCDACRTIIAATFHTAGRGNLCNGCTSKYIAELEQRLEEVERVRQIKPEFRPGQWVTIGGSLYQLADPCEGEPDGAYLRTKPRLSGGSIGRTQRCSVRPAAPAAMFQYGALARYECYDDILQGCVCRYKGDNDPGIVYIMIESREIPVDADLCTLIEPAPRH